MALQGSPKEFQRSWVDLISSMAILQRAVVEAQEKMSSDEAGGEEAETTAGTSSALAEIQSSVLSGKICR